MRTVLLAGIVALTLLALPATAEEAHVPPVRNYVLENVRPWLSDTLLVSAVEARNAADVGLESADVTALDQKWRAEVESDDHPMIDEVLSNALSIYLRGKQDASGGAITEIFVMDAKGLNAGQSDVTSDYWQGDEEKFTKSFGAGPGAIFIDKAEKDESTQMLQSQASMTIVDAAGKAIGAITVGINLDEL